MPPQTVGTNLNDLREEIPTSPQSSGSGGYATKLEAGAILSDKYKILRMIGMGGMGCVYQAQEVDFDVDRSVAIKVLPPNYTQDEKVLRRFEEEIKIAARLDHPNIVPIYSIGRENAMLYFVMAYLRGSTLKQKLAREGVFKEEDILKVTKMIGDALGYLHDQGCIHRDVKTNNIMFNSSGHPILMDFGIAKVEGGEMLTTEGEILGTATYMAPEQWNGEIDHRSDIYSFGCVLYEIAAGKPPFVSPKIPELMKMHLDSPVPPLENVRADLSAQLRSAIYKCLEKDPAFRFQSMYELREAVGHSSSKIVVNDEPMEATIALSPEKVLSESTILNKAEELRNQGHLEEALRLVEKEAAGGDVSGEVEELLGELRGAVALEVRTLKNADEAVRNKMHEQAEAELSEFLRNHESVLVRKQLEAARKYREKTDEIYDKARELQESAQYSKAKAYYEKVLTRAPSHSGAMAGAQSLSKYKSESASKPPTALLAGGGGLLLVLVLFFALPLIMPGTFSKINESLGDTFRSQQWYNSPPYFNAVSAYKRAYSQADKARRNKLNDKWWDFSDRMISIGKNLRKRELYERAQRYFIAAQELTGHDPRTSSQIDYHVNHLLYKARLAISHNQKKEALMLLGLAQELDPKNGQIISELKNAKAMK